MLEEMKSWKLSATFFLLCFSSYSFACTFTITNNCPYTIWPGTLSGAGTTPLSTTGFQLPSGQSVSISSVPTGWSGRIWARTGCNFDASGIGTCQTGDCGGRLECNGSGASPPASLFEITLGTGDMKDFYDVSIVDGYNLPLVAVPRGMSGQCNATGCISNLNMGMYVCSHLIYIYIYAISTLEPYIHGTNEQVVLKSFRWTEEKEMWLHAEVHAKRLDPTNIAAAASLPTQPHAGHHSIQESSRGRVQGLTVMPTTIAPALSHARPLSIPSFFVPSLGK